MRKKSGFLTFVFSLVPGAGQMYQGHLRRGCSIMLAFFLVCAISVFTNIGELCILLPVLWFYAFFDAINKSSYTYEELAAIPDEPIFGMDFLNRIVGGELFHGRANTLVGGALVFVGIVMFYRSVLVPFINPYIRMIPGLSDLLYKMPTIFIGVVIILLGVRIIRGKDTKIDRNDR